MISGKTKCHLRLEMLKNSEELESIKAYDIVMALSPLHEDST
ncbi:hypothetical protein ATHSA_p10028 (plasmid) [Athalassotoga saccharophila]|uniref:Uncharacterized protein n=1 Tax=Athalassotoga saccharophila TaxID=1441386 RepID=A0A6N4TEZ7_9BACT|nr:hypothetical protein ATHSA_p10028 [Athalassotoga saccharophila]